MFASVALSTVTFFPIRHVGWRSASVIDAVASRSRIPLAKWSAGRSENYPPHFRIRPSGDALENRAVLAVHRNEIGIAALPRLLHKLPGDDERLLVRQRDALPRVERRERRVESGSADYRVDDDVRVLARCRLDEAVPRLCSTAPALFPRADLRLDEPHVSRMKLAHLLGEQIGIAVRG